MTAFRWGGWLLGAASLVVSAVPWRGGVEGKANPYCHQTPCPAPCLAVTYEIGGAWCRRTVDPTTVPPKSICCPGVCVLVGCVGSDSACGTVSWTWSWEITTPTTEGQCQAPGEISGTACRTADYNCPSP